MRIEIDTDAQTLNGGQLYSKESFELLSDLWVKVGWDQKYPYTFSWLGRPVIQAPEDLIRAQEVIYRVRPDVVIETGVAHGGSLVFYASVLRSMSFTGRVIGIDIEIRPHNRQAIEMHEMCGRITLLEGDSISPAIVDRVSSLVLTGDVAIVILDSKHTKDHVLAELNAYHRFVTPGSYIVATDGNMRDLADTPRGSPDWYGDNPQAAVAEFLKKHPEFVLEQPGWPFNESLLDKNVTYWPSAWLRRQE